MTMPTDAWDVRLDYEVCPDADSMPSGPVLSAEAVEGGGATVRVAGDSGGFAVESIQARDLRGAAEARTLPVKGGAATDAGAREGTLTRYEAVATDAFGRRSTTGSTVLNRLPREVLRGEFSFHYLQGWSIEQGREAGPEEADLRFQACAGGLTNITLSAEGGILNLGRSGEPDRGGPGAEEIFRAILRADPGEVVLGREAMADSRRPSSDVFLLRTRNGGWAKVAIVSRGTARSWTEYPATLVYAWNPHEPVFEEGEVEETRWGIGLARLDPGEAAARRRAGRLAEGAGESGEARELLARLESVQGISINAPEFTLEDFGNTLERMEVPVEYAPELDRKATVSLRLRGSTLMEAIDGAAEAFRCSWRVTGEGRLRFEPRAKGR
jgi:hypothetical protein